MIQLFLPDGALVSETDWVALVQPADTDSADVEFMTHLLRNGKSTSVTDLGYRGVAVVPVQGGVLAVGRLGRTTLFEGDSVRELVIPDVEAIGFLTAARRVGDAVFTVGMWRQVYMWTGESGWIPAHEGILDEREPPDRVSGLLSIDGTPDGDLWAVGLGGEIWNRVAGNWREVPSPSNLMLEQVRVAPNGDVYAVGQQGLLLRGRGERWEVLQQDLTDEDFRGLEWFHDCLFLCTSSRLIRYRPEAEQFDVLSVTPEPGTRFSRLRAGFDVLCLFGGHALQASHDGEVWHERTLSED